jgi:hypothetical protein
LWYSKGGPAAAALALGGLQGPPWHAKPSLLELSTATWSTNKRDERSSGLLKYQLRVEASAAVIREVA